MKQNDLTCPKCDSPDAYFDGSLWNCPTCFHEWTLSETKSAAETNDSHIRDAHGNILQEGDSVTIIKDFKVKGASSSIKVGTKVKDNPFKAYLSEILNLFSQISPSASP